METYTERVGNKLNVLLEKNYDAEKGYKKVAENVKNPSLKNFFNKKASERLNFGRDLKTEISFFYKDINKRGSVSGAAHRAWMDVKSVISLNNEKAMLEEAIRGEETALNEYEEIIMETNLPISTKEVLAQHQEKIKSELDTIKTLYDLKTL